MIYYDQKYFGQPHRKPTTVEGRLVGGALNIRRGWGDMMEWKPIWQLAVVQFQYWDIITDRLFFNQTFTFVWVGGWVIPSNSWSTFIYGAVLAWESWRNDDLMRLWQGVVLVQGWKIGMPTLALFSSSRWALNRVAVENYSHGMDLWGAPFVLVQVKPFGSGPSKFFYRNTRPANIIHLTKFGAFRVSSSTGGVCILVEERLLCRGTTPTVAELC